MLQKKGPCVTRGEKQAVRCLILTGRAVLAHSPGRLCPEINLSFLLLAGEQTKALVTQLTLFNRVLTELREDIRDQVGLRGY